MQGSDLCIGVTTHLHTVLGWVKISGLMCSLAGGWVGLEHTHGCVCTVLERGGVLRTRKGECIFLAKED